MNKEIFEACMATFENETYVTVYENKPISNSKYKSENMHSQMSLIVDSLMRACFKKMSSDNITIILICFKNFKQLFETNDLEKNASKLKKMRNENIVSYTFKSNLEP